MTKDEYEDFALRYKGCGACFPMYHTLSRFEKMWFTAIQKDVAELEKENAELKEAVKHFNPCGEWDDDVHDCEFRHYAIEYGSKLAEAKKIIKDLCGMVRELNKPNVQLTNVDYSLSEAEQFLNSEVENEV